MQLLKNKYSNWYFNIIEGAKDRPLIKTCNMEIHHIIPKSLGGSNKKENLVSLTYREHYVCHLLLTKMVRGEAKYKMAWALMLLSSKRKNTNSRNFEIARIILSKSAKNRPKTAEWRKKMSIRMSGSNNPNYNPNKIRDLRTPEQRKKEGILKMTATKQYQARNGLLPIQKNQELKELIRSKRVGRKQPESQKKLASDANSLWYLVQLPNNEIIKVFNLSKFCKNNNLDRSNLYSTYTGRTKQHKGYKLLSYLNG
jgi:hypothetical protein